MPELGGIGAEAAIVAVRPGFLKRGESWSFSAVTSGPVDAAVASNSVPRVTVAGSSSGTLPPLGRRRKPPGRKTAYG